jgi:hypothetical protein
MFEQMKNRIGSPSSKTVSIHCPTIHVIRSSWWSEPEQNDPQDAYFGVDDLLLQRHHQLGDLRSLFFRDSGYVESIATKDANAFAMSLIRHRRESGTNRLTMVMVIQLRAFTKDQ